MAKQVFSTTRDNSDGDGGDAETENVASHEGDGSSKQKDYRRIVVGCSSINSRNQAITLLVFLGLSLWISPTSTTAEAFASLATTSEWQRLHGIAGFNNNGRGGGKSPLCRRDRTRKHRLRSRTSLSMTFSAGINDGRQFVLPLASVAAAAPDGGSVSAGNEKFVVETLEPRPPPHTTKPKKKTDDRVRVNTVGEMRQRLSEGRSLFELDARGDSQEMLDTRSDEHPVLEIIRKRAEAGTKPGSHGDGAKVGLAIEGGGMRGCVSAGMIAAVSTLGLMDTFDAVYGSSAGSLVGAYAIAGQEGMPRLGCSVYYDTLTGSGRHFIDTRQIFRAMGLGLLGTVATRWRGLRELVRQKWGSPVLNLNYLLRDVVEKQRPLDWEGFWEKQADQPLHVIASGVASKKSVVLTSSGGHFRTLRELTECMRASMLLPGITGPMVTLPNIEERLVDSQLYEPIPFHTALNDGCTHVLVLRSRPDGGNLLGKPKLAERLISRRFFKRKNKDPDSYAYVKSGGHKKLYAESVLTLNEAARAKSGDSGPHVMPMCLPASEPEVGRLEQRRERILEGVRKGYEHAHVILRRTVPDHATARLDGRQAALQAFPESILDEEIDPLVREVLDRSSRGKVRGQGGQCLGGQTTLEP